MTTQISRRALTKGAAWAAPVVVASGAAPALAASPACTGTPYTILRYEPRIVLIDQSGADGFANNVDFTVRVTENVPVSDPCATFVDNTGQPVTWTVDTRRYSGSTTRYRTITLSTPRPNYVTVAQTVNTRNNTSWPIGSVDHAWTITFTPSAVYTGLPGHDFLVNLYPGDGGVSRGRIMESLYVNGVRQNTDDATPLYF